MRLISGILAVLAVFPSAAWSVTLDDQLACSETAHDFVSQLVDAHSIKTPPQRVEPNSVNAYRPANGANLTAFGLPVHAVFGYQPDDPLFKVGAGEASAHPVYGAVVRGSADTVKRLLTNAGSTAVVHSVVPLILTAIVCTQQSADGGSQVGMAP
ncbi:hypothetical protein BTH42_29940 [Burkholderia sp. SRS-W-2-2016]|uniref:hypothetical protein n=1 Tax=Burkholderia sp. SRS-W-2-2016 TaxID=1926878 RepID=UPI00094B414F|nr:hypothetical protein [Burkholderia sp. SRS-W-2-2016]OLL28010.1 hypothetical protein BTH42_29940 [Burkholderia sp. SRS-W-2-2016]